MHLSYRGVVHQSSAVAVGKRRRSPLIKQGQRLAKQVAGVSAQAVAVGSRSARKVASLSTPMDMPTLLKSSAATRTLGNAALEEQYHSLERNLQLAYAVNDHARIALLESEIERLTGWRFNKGR